MLCDVLKTITGPGGIEYAPGERVDVSTWRWVDQLIDQRKLRPVVESLPLAEPVPAKPGRPKKNKEE
jgi:hypothetical protein